MCWPPGPGNSGQQDSRSKLSWNSLEVWPLQGFPRSWTLPQGLAVPQSSQRGRFLSSWGLHLVTPPVICPWDLSPSGNPDCWDYGGTDLIASHGWWTLSSVTLYSSSKCLATVALGPSDRASLASLSEIPHQWKCPSSPSWGFWS